MCWISVNVDQSYSSICWPFTDSNGTASLHVMFYIILYAYMYKQNGNGMHNAHYITFVQPVVHKRNFRNSSTAKIYNSLKEQYKC